MKTTVQHAVLQMAHFTGQHTAHGRFSQKITLAKSDYRTTSNICLFLYMAHVDVKCYMTFKIKLN